MVLHRHGDLIHSDSDLNGRRIQQTLSIAFLRWSSTGKLNIVPPFCAQCVNEIATTLAQDSSE